MYTRPAVAGSPIFIAFNEVAVSDVPVSVVAPLALSVVNAPVLGVVAPMAVLLTVDPAIVPAVMFAVVATAPVRS